MTRPSCLTPTICAFHLGFGLGEERVWIGAPCTGDTTVLAVTHRPDVVSSIWRSRFGPEGGHLTFGAVNEKGRHDATLRQSDHRHRGAEQGRGRAHPPALWADQFLHGWETGRAIIGFRLKGYPVRMTLPLPILEDFEHYARKNGTKTRRTPHRPRRMPTSRPSGRTGGPWCWS